MREWILKHTDITDTEYDKIINLKTVSIEGKSENPPIEKISNHSFVNIALFSLNRPSLMKRIKFKISKKKDCNKKNYYIYRNIEFYILAEFLKSKEYKLYTTERQQQCFHLNSQICLLLSANSFFITALCQSPYRTYQKTYLHSFVLIITEDKQEYIIDGTANIIMKKEQYFSIFKPQIISSLSKEQLQHDLSLIAPFEKDGLIYKGEYYCFPEQVINGIKKYTKAKQ